MAESISFNSSNNDQPIYLGGSEFFDEKTGKYLSPLPQTPYKSTVSMQTNVQQVLTAPIDTILINEETLPIEAMTDLIFENIGGQELINIARNDTINGQPIIYQPIRNLALIQQQYNPNNIINVQATSDKYFKNFAVKLDSKIPNVGNGPGGENIYIEPQTGELIIEFVNIESGEQVQVEIITSGTIYKADL